MSQVLTKQMPARRRGTSVHTLVEGQRDVTTVTLSSCRTLGGGWFVPSWPQPMARHRTPLPTTWSCSGNLATCTLALMVADPLSCSGQDRVPKSYMGQWVPTLPFPSLFPHLRPHGSSGILWSRMPVLQDAPHSELQFPHL